VICSSAVGGTTVGRNTVRFGCQLVESFRGMGPIKAAEPQMVVGILNYDAVCRSVKEA
jgi:hypothetical protein